MRRPSVPNVLIFAFLSLGIFQMAPAATKLEKIVNPGILGVTVKYAEFLIGSPAIREAVDDLGFQRNTYEYQGCYIGLGVKNEKVVSVNMYFDPGKGCDIDVGEIVNRRNIKGSSTKFKDYAWRGPLNFTDPQLPSCNACGEGSFNATVEGVGAMGNLSVQLTADTYGKGNRHGEWRDLLRSNGIDGANLPLTAENCPLRRFDAQAFHMLKETPVTGIAFSREPRALQPECNGETVWSRIMRK